MLIKRTAGARDWFLVDNMRGWTANSASDNSKVLNPNLSAAESDNLIVIPTATGFTIPASSALNNDAHIYIAIRRGPMKVPTSGTSVFAPVAQNATNPTSTVTTNFPVDMSISAQRTRANDSNTWVNDRLRGSSTSSTQWLQTSTTNAELTEIGFGFDNNTGYVDNFWGNPAGAGAGGSGIAYWNFRRAPGFMDVVCYTGTGTNGQVINHNLSAIPEMVIIKGRDSTFDWFVYQTGLSSGNSIYLNTTSAQTNDGGPAFSLSSTALTISRTYVDNLNSSGLNYVAYLFATCPGVSKVTNFTGTGALQTINCGFTSGARFVLIKRTDSTGNWFVWDSSRGLSSSNDPYLLLNSTAAEVTSTNWVDTTSTGFQVTAASGNDVNISGASYIALAIS
jgi:hypothetical protein